MTQKKIVYDSKSVLRVSALNRGSLSYSSINLLELISYKLFISALMMAAPASSEVSVSTHMPNR
jgi:hypothetical protein